MSKNNFILYKDFDTTLDLLNDDQAGKLFKALYKYVNGRHEPHFEDGMLIVAFNMLKTQLERDLVKYNERVLRNIENGKKGGRPKNKPLTTIDGRLIPKETDNHFVYLLFDTQRNEYKIGETQNLIKRRYAIKEPTNNLQVFDFAIHDTFTCQEIERHVIKNHQNSRISGDWFDFTNEEIKHIQKVFKKPSGFIKNRVGYKKADSDSDSVSDSVRDSDSKKTKAKKVYFDNKELNTLFYEFILMRKKIKKPMTDKAIELAIGKLNKQSDNIKTQMLEYSIMNNYQGLFIPKEQTESKQERKFGNG